MYYETFTWRLLYGKQKKCQGEKAAERTANLKMPLQEGPRHNIAAPGRVEGKSTVAPRMLHRDQEAAVDRGAALFYI